MLVIGGQWSMCSFRTLIYESDISLTYPFSTSHLSIFIRNRCRWTVSVFGPILYGLSVSVDSSGNVY